MTKLTHSARCSAPCFATGSHHVQPPCLPLPHQRLAPKPNAAQPAMGLAFAMNSIAACAYFMSRRGIFDRIACASPCFAPGLHHVRTTLPVSTASTRCHCATRGTASKGLVFAMNSAAACAYFIGHREIFVPISKEGCRKTCSQTQPGPALLARAFAEVLRRYCGGGGAAVVMPQ